jgi:heme/copper-type cytochrome/quinol oxidase subunit 3
MATRSAGRLRLAAEARRTPVVPNGALGMLMFVASEGMLFAGLISAFHIIRSSALVWPPPDQPRLPVQETLVNTAALLASGVALFLAQRAFRRDWRRAKAPLAVAMALGAFFVGAQGVEWVALVRQGLTLTSSSLGSFFYLIVGMHGLHAVAALAGLAYTWWLLQRGWRAQNQLAAAAVFWYFVVGLWPILYSVVYL